MSHLNAKDVKYMFNELASSYDNLNDLFSFGLHRIWKNRLISSLYPSSGEDWLDICCGTGDLSFILARNLREGGSVFGIDTAENQLSIARERANGFNSVPIYFLNRDALNTNLPSNIFDGVVMAYGLRNLVEPLKGIKEMHRLLKPSGRAAILDFIPLKDNSLQNFFQKKYLRNIVVPCTSLFGLGKYYKYIEESLKDFPDGDQQINLSKQAGFNTAKHIPIAGGLMGITYLYKERKFS